MIVYVPLCMSHHLVIQSVYSRSLIRSLRVRFWAPASRASRGVRPAPWSPARCVPRSCLCVREGSNRSDDTTHDGAHNADSDDDKHNRHNDNNDNHNRHNDNNDNYNNRRNDRNNDKTTGRQRQHTTHTCIVLWSILVRSYFVIDCIAIVMLFFVMAPVGQL